MDDKILEKKLKNLKTPELPMDFSKNVMRYIHNKCLVEAQKPALTFQKTVNYLSIGIFGILCLFGIIQFMSNMVNTEISEYFSLMFSNFDVFTKHLSLVLTAFFKAFPLLSFVKLGIYLALFFISIKVYKILHPLNSLKIYG